MMMGLRIGTPGGLKGRSEAPIKIQHEVIISYLFRLF
jgi:hypothetical protein